MSRYHPTEPLSTTPIPTQRWVSTTEPELGLGIILSVDRLRLEILFPAADEKRVYAIATAPLRRVTFAEGDRIRTSEGIELAVRGVEERDGVLTYLTEAGEIPEAGLAATISFKGPEERLFAGHVDDLATYELRAEALALRSRIDGAPVRGYVGGRIDLIPHQLSIAGEVAARLAPRVLLADEVGLGKTIEAGLILHRLHQTGRADRILILLPEPLVHQWFVELLRRFNLAFSIYDEERCAAIEESEPDANPFLQSQLVICGIHLLAGDRRRAAQALEAGWDLLVVDEAHHLEWSPEFASHEYRLVESLAAATPGVLLLTATPGQLGPEGHFARLRLLDPERYADLERFLAEADRYEAVAHAVDRITNGERLTDEDRALFADGSERIARHAAELDAGVDGAAERLIADLLDGFGTGRVMFRNTRAALTGFPERKALLAPVDLIATSADANDPSGDDGMRDDGMRDARSDATTDAISTEPTTLFTAGVDAEISSKVKWLAALLKDLRTEKILLICRTRALAEEIHERLPHEINVKGALFHEGLTLVQRDRNAAAFAEKKGVRILICSEIGSEGRNFQFAHHLVLFDLPADPELLEQRIGRLDRIGQTGTVHIHVPYVSGTTSEVMARWYHEGLNAFEENLKGATEIVQAVESELRDALAAYDESTLAALIERSREERRRVAEKLEHGYDRLLQLNSNKPERAAALAAGIRDADADRAFETFVVRLMDYYGVTVEEHERRTYLFKPGHLLTDAFPALPEEGLWATFDRTRALSRDDIGFITWDHPFVRSVIDLLADGEQGNASYGVWKDPAGEAMFLEIIAIVEPLAPAHLHVDRFLPPTPLRVAVDNKSNDLSDDPALAAAPLRDGDIGRILDHDTIRKSILPAMLAAALEHAAARTAALVAAATARMTESLDREIERLEDLHQINNHVDRDEIAAMRRRQSDLAAAIAAARLRVGGMRVVVRRG